MTEREIQLLGFEIKYDDGDGNWDKYHYYTYEVSKGLQFISNASDEVKEGEEWFVEFLDTEFKIRFHKFGEIQSLINLLEKHLIKN
jgi:hypothetical protein